MVEYRRCCFDDSLGGECMTMQYRRKINTNLQFEIHKMSFQLLNSAGCCVTPENEKESICCSE